MQRGPLAASAPRCARLAARIALGDLSAEDEFVRAFAPSVREVLRHRLHARDAVDDLCHDTLCAALLHLRHADLREAARLPAYVWGIARNLARAHGRERRETPACDLDPPDRRADPERSAMAAESRERLRTALARLAARDRALAEGLLLGEDKAAACARLGLSPPVFDVAKFRALRRLRLAWLEISAAGGLRPPPRRPRRRARPPAP